MWLGIDFGTTNSAISFSDGERVHTFQVDAQLSNLLPSLIYITKHYETHVGTAARDTYLEKNTNRPSRFESVDVGIIRLDVGGASGFKQIEQMVKVMIDVLSPGRLFRSVKTGLRTIEYDGSVVFGRNYSVDQLISILFKQMVEIVEPQLGEPITQIVMGRPVKFSDDPAVDRRAEERIAAAAKLVGIEDVTFLPEPIAAAYAYHRDFQEPTNTFIFDFGGGTLDLTVAELGGAEPKILATEGVLIGGDDFDKRLLEFLLPHFGKGARLKGDKPVPEHIWGALLDWQTVEEMKHSDAIKTIEQAAEPHGSTNPTGMKALRDLVTNNLYYQLLQHVERAKVELSSAESTTLSLHVQNVHIDETITRDQFNRLINNEIWQIDHAIDDVITRSGLTHNDIQFVVNTGGSSQIPIFRQLIADKFKSAESATRAERNMTGVVQGLGIYGHDLDAQDDDLMPLIRSRLLDQILTAPPPPITPKTTLPKRDFSHAVVGIDAQGEVQLLPYQSGRPLPDVSPIRVASAAFTSQAGKILLGTSLSRFIIPQLDDLQTIMQDRTQTPFYLKLDRSKGEEFIFVDKWGAVNPLPWVILVTRWGNVRAFQRQFVATPLQNEGNWKLDLRGKADPPSAFIPAKRTSQLLLMTKSGRATRLSAKNISVRGSKGLKLKSAEKVHALNTDDLRQLIIVNQNGHGERLVISDITEAPKTGSAGRIIYKPGNVCGLLPVNTQKTARAITSKGRIVELALADVRLYSGQHQLTPLDPQETLVHCWL